MLQNKKWLLILVSITFILLLAACGGNDDDTNNTATGGNAQASAGEEAYNQSCVSCHGNDLQGAAGPALTDLSLTKEEIVDVIQNGRPGMPGGLASGDEEAIADYLLSQ